MAILNVILLVFFVIVSILLILIVLVQSEDGDSLGGIFAGGSGSAFGSRSGNILTRITTILGACFLIISFTLALINRGPSRTSVEDTARQQGTGTANEWWQEEGTAQNGESK